MTAYIKELSIFKVIQMTFYPAMLIISLTAIFLLAGNLPQKYFIFIPGALLIILIPVFILGEKFMPYRNDWQKSHGDQGADFLQTFVVLPAASKLSEFLLPMVFYFPVLWLAETYNLSGMLQGYGLATGFIIALLSCELLYYWFHRLCHKIKLFWRFHSVHHGAKRVYWVNSGRFHFLEALASSAAYFLPLILLNASPEMIIMVISFSSITGFMEHVNISLEAGYFNYVFNSPQLHRWHHSNVIKESSRNYGKALVIWDLLFGTFYLPKNKEVANVGVDGADVPSGFIGQLIFPFKTDKKTD